MLKYSISAEVQFYYYFHLEPADSQHPNSSTSMEGEVYIQSPQMVELCKKFELRSDDIDKEVSDEHINEIYSQLEKWEEVANHLGLTGPDIEGIVRKASSFVGLMRLYTLQEWKKKKKINKTNTYQVLLEALLKCGCTSSAEDLCKLLKKT